MFFLLFIAIPKSAQTLLNSLPNLLTYYHFSKTPKSYQDNRIEIPIIIKWL